MMPLRCAPFIIDTLTLLLSPMLIFRDAMLDYDIIISSTARRHELSLSAAP